MRKLNYNYDDANDILYVAFANKSFSYGDEIIDGCVIMKDFDSNKITGFTIFDFMDKYKTNRLPILELPVKINYSVDIIPFLTNF